MFVSVRFKREIRDAEVIRCAAYEPYGGRLNFFFETTESGFPKGPPFLSIADDQIAIWEVVNSPEDVKVPEPDETVRLPVTSSTRELLKEGQYEVGVVNGTSYVDLPLYRRRV